MIKNYRSFMISFLSILGLGILFDTQGLLQELWADLSEEKILRLQLQEKQAALAAAAPLSQKILKSQLNKVSKPLMDQVLAAAKFNACQLVNLQAEYKSPPSSSSTDPKALPQPRQLIIKLQLKANFFSLYRFLRTLAQQSLPLRLEHYVLKKQGDFLDISLQFAAFPKAFWLASEVPLQHPQLSCCGRDPFEPREVEWTGVYSQALTVEQIHYVGYLSEGELQGALVLLPDGRTYDLYPGSSVGEQWKVISMDAEVLTLMNIKEDKQMKVHRWK